MLEGKAVDIPITTIATPPENMHEIFKMVNAGSEFPSDRRRRLEEKYRAKKVLQKEKIDG
jgi:hypothetical protein